MAEIKRYDICAVIDDNRNGEYVLYSDHLAALKAAQNSRDLVILAELRAEDIECVNLCLDRLNIPRATLTATYSLWGRVECAIKAAVAAEREACASIAPRMFHAAATGEEIADAIEARGADHD